MPRSKSPNGFRSGRKLRKSPGRTLIVSESFFRPGSSERLRCYFDGHSIALPGTLGLLHKTVKSGNCSSTKRGRTGFDSSLEAQAACRGWFVGLVKNRTKKIKANHEDLALAA